MNARILAALALTLASFPALAGPPEPIPGPEEETRTIGVLEARDEGAIKLDVRGKGGEQVRVSIRNTSPRRLNVVFPPGLVASAAAGQFQSMGLGDPENNRGGFGSFAPEAEPFSDAGLARGKGVAVPSGKLVELTVPAVCLDFGAPTPTPAASFTLMDVDDYTPNPAARRALRALATVGTSHGVAQAVAWHAFNGLTFENLATQTAYTINAQERALAAGLARRLDEGESGPAAMARDRLTVQVKGEGPLADAADRLSGRLEGRTLLGLPARVASDETPASGPALRLDVSLASAQEGGIRGRVAVRYASGAGGGRWTLLGSAPVLLEGDADALDASAAAEAIDHAVAAAFVTVRPIRRAVGLTTFQVNNRLPFTLAHVIVKAGDAPVTLPALGVGPQRHATAPIEAARATVDRVILNGL